jgi:putative flippase GtrA
MAVAESGAAAAPRESRRLVRFVAAGAVNTALSVLVYQGALFLMPHVPAYMLSYVAGIVIAYLLYSRRVFDVPLTVSRFAAFVLFYSASLAIGTILNAVLIEQLGIAERLAIFATIVLMLPVNYLGSRHCLRA